METGITNFIDGTGLAEVFVMIKSGSGVPTDSRS